MGKQQSVSSAFGSEKFYTLVTDNFLCVLRENATYNVFCYPMTLTPKTLNV